MRDVIIDIDHMFKEVLLIVMLEVHVKLTFSASCARALTLFSKDEIPRATSNQHHDHLPRDRLE